MRKGMAVDQGYLEHIKELLSPVEGVTYRAMFGGYGVFHEGDMFALISGSTSTLYFKVGDLNREAFQAAGSEAFGRMPYWEVPANVLEDSEEMQEWASVAVQVGHITATKKRPT